MRQVRRNAFTLIEVLVVIAIIVILAGIAIFGTRKVINNSKISSTRATLATLQGMLGDLDAKTRLNKAPPEWIWIDESGTPVSRVPPGPSGDWDLWRIGYKTTARAYGAASAVPDALDAPGLVTDSADAPRNVCGQVLNTQAIMRMLLALPSNRAALEKVAPDRYFTPQWFDATAQIPVPGADGVLGTADDLGHPVVAPYYPLGTQVLYTDPSTKQTTKYVARTGGASATAIPPATPWAPDNSPATPILLDAWNNPIIFVPASGLRVRLLNGKSANDPTDTTQTWIIVSPEGKVQGNGSGNPVVTQVGRPFFASAGPDGDFAKGDDNIYSFEQ